MVRKIFCHVTCFLALCAISARTENAIRDFGKIANYDEWKIDVAKISSGERAKRENFSSKEEINYEEISCSRYCVRRKIRGDSGHDTIKRVNIIWSIVDETRITFNGETSNSWGITSVQEISRSDERRCELYLELGCETLIESNSTIHDEFPNFDQKKLVSTNGAIGPSLVSFGVNEVTDKLRIVTFGKISHVVLEIPIAPRANDFTDKGRMTPTFSLSSTRNAEGLLIDARNPPSGEWRLKLFGIKNSNYNFSITSISSKESMHDSMMKNDSKTALPLTNEIIFQNEHNDFDVNSSERLSRSQRLAYVKKSDDNYATQAIKLDDGQRSIKSMTNDTKSSISENVDREIVEIEERGKIKFEDSEENARILDKSELEDLSRISDVHQSIRKKTVVDITERTELVAQPGRFHDIVFTVTNNQQQLIRYGFEVRSQPSTVISCRPERGWINAGDKIYVFVRMGIPNIQESEFYVVTLYVRGINDYEVAEKSAYIYVYGSDRTAIKDSEKPSLKYSFNDNCSGKLHRDICGRSLWSVEITVNDPDSGLKTVTSLPTGVQPRNDFIAGSKKSEIFHYTSTCCDPIVDITATDVYGNSFTQKIDVRAWDNLTSGEIAAVVVGALLILLLIILLIILIIYCIRKRKSHDLSYSQRYGSRPPASAERTNF